MSTRRLAALAVLGAVTAAVPALGLEGSLDAAVLSRYLWRGMTLNDRPVLQPSLTLAHGALEATVWASVDLTDDQGHRYQDTEIDYALSYTFDLPRVALAVTAYTYTYPHTGYAATTEVWASATWKTVLEPTLTVVRDVDEVDGTYLLLTASQPLGLLRSRSSDGLVLSVNVGHGDRAYAAGYFPTSDVAGVTDVGAQLDWPLALGPGELCVTLQVATFTSSRIRVPDFEDDRTSAVLGVSYSLPFGP